MHISLTPALEKMIRRKVDSGLYNNASEVVREALRLMAAQEEAGRLKLDRLRKALADGEESGLARDYSLEGLLARLDAEGGEQDSRG